ncbi:MAG: efflux RND transporter permease subunit, partial [Rhodothermales bacterium]|nr:efflux RND transporter permease subunit [Rhodothermales bacterium]
LILAAQFESLLQPLIVLFTIPVALSGVAMALAVTGSSLNLLSLTGCIVLVGIVVNDAIVKVDFINRSLSRGLTVREAIQVAGRDRLRPIVMTTVTTVFGLVPLALGFGEGASLRAPLAIAIIGGLSVGSPMTLIVVPSLYEFVAQPRLKRPCYGA